MLGLGLMMDESETAAEGDEDEEADPRMVLASLGMWETFGERSLLKNEKRYATVRATSDELHTMCIARDVLEASLSLRLSDVLEYHEKEDAANEHLKGSLSSLVREGGGRVVFKPRRAT